MPRPEERAREAIDHQLAEAGWTVQDFRTMNLYAARGVAVREFPLQWGPADYLLFVDRRAVGVIEAKRPGVTLTGVELQADKYSDGVPASVPTVIRPLPFLYQSTGVESRFTNRLDPECRAAASCHTEGLERDKPNALPTRDSSPCDVRRRKDKGEMLGIGHRCDDKPGNRGH